MGKTEDWKNAGILYEWCLERRNEMIYINPESIVRGSLTVSFNIDLE